MRRGVVCGILGGVLLAAAVGQAAEQQLLTLKELKQQANKNDALEWYIDRNGVPDVAETRPLSDVGPWDKYEVALYYLDARREIVFARAAILSTDDIYLKRLERPLTDEEVAALSANPSLRTATDAAPADATPVDVASAEVVPADAEPADATMEGAEAAADLDSSDPVARAEAAAARAEQAADMVEQAAVRTEHAADRAEAVVAKMMARSH